MSHASVSVTPPPGEPHAWDLTLDARTRALEQAADLAVLAPSVHNTQPWLIELQPDRMQLRADRTRQLSALDPQGRALVQSVGAALFNVRVALADRGWAVAVDRVPDRGDPDLLAVIRPMEGTPEAKMAELAPAVRRRRTNRRAFTGAPVPVKVLRELTAIADEEGAVLVPVLTSTQRRLVARLTRQADRLQNAEPAYRAELRRWTTRARAKGDGVPAAVVPHVDGRQHDELPLRDFDSGGTGALPEQTHSDGDQTLVLIATRTDDQSAWLSSGEALQHLLLRLTELGWVASPITQAIEVPLTRTQLRSAMTWDAHPQMLLRIGHAAPTAPTPRRRRDDVVVNSQRPPEPDPVQERSLPHRRPTPPAQRPAHRRVPDGRGGTTWI